MGGTAGTMRGWLLALACALALFLFGLVLSYLLWNRMESSTLPPCSQGVALRVQAAMDSLGGAASLLSRQSRELRITPAHIFHFPLRHVLVVPHGADARTLAQALGRDWPCAATWAREVSSDEAFLSIIAVGDQDIVPLRLRKEDFDLAESAPSGTIPSLAPDSVLVLRKRPGSEQVLMRVE
ncbi:hypothetical protein [Desulfocurvus sp. DL9XJH121]